jgi:hypothetical protein
LVFLLALRISDLDLGFVRFSLVSDDPACLSFSGAGLAALLPPLLAETYALDRRFKPLESSVSRGNILDNVRNERNISLMLMSSLAEHSSTFTLRQSTSLLIKGSTFGCVNGDGEVNRRFGTGWISEQGESVRAIPLWNYES